MRKTLKEEIRKSIHDNYDNEEIVTLRQFQNKLSVDCALIAEKHIKIARLEGMIEVYRMLPNYKIKTKLLEQELEKLKKQ